MMHPDKRRAGRAIRKQRREARQLSNEQLATVADLARAVGAAFSHVADAFTAFARDVARAFTNWPSDGPTEQHPLWETENPKPGR